MLAFRGTIARVPFPTILPLRRTDYDAAIKEASFKRDIIRHAKKRFFIDLDNVLCECKFCNKAFPDRKKATTHQVTHFKDPSFEIKTYTCSSCNRAFATEQPHASIESSPSNWTGQMISIFIHTRISATSPVHENFNAEEWLDTLIPAKPKKSRKQHSMQSRQ